MSKTKKGLHKKIICAPNVVSKNDFSCFTSLEIIEMANALNQYLKKTGDKKMCKSQNKICINVTPIDFNKKQNIHKIWYSLYKKLNKLCKNEDCWIDLPFIEQIPNQKLKQKIKKYTFKPKMTKTRYTWLSTIDINEVLNQYDLKHKSFKFYGAYPSDFYKYTNFNYQELRDYNNIAIVFNLDTYSEPGSHWVSFYIDNKKKTCEYFDSVGNPPNKHIMNFINRVLSVVLIGYKLHINTVVHQVKNTECGVYSIHYIIQRLSGKSFDKVSKSIIRDNEMNQYRNLIFRERT